jgi:predicted ATPase
MTNYEPLKKDGSNHALVLAYLIQDKEKKQTLFNLLSYIFPFFKELEIRKVFENYIQLWMKEKYDKEAWIPSFLLSDGTIHVLAIIIALFFDDSKIVFIEEPDRYLHPYLISALVELMKDASRNKQIFITTHNPEVLRHIDKEDILLVSRDKNGFSKISRPANKKKIKTFLKNDLGMAELFIDNILEI